MRRLALVVFLLALPGCGSDSLDGSLAEAFDLSYSSILIRQSPSAVQVTYLRSHGNEVVMRITVATEGVDLSSGVSINLAGEWSAGHPRAAVSRAVDGEPVRQLPPVVKGELRLNDAVVPGKDLSGSFAVSFGEGGDLGSGRTLNGHFSGTVQGTPQ